MVYPPRDYPEQQPVSFDEKSSAESSSITVRSVLDRLNSEQPVTDAMIHTAVTNLHTEDSLKNFKNTSKAPLQSLTHKRHTQVKETLRSLFKNAVITRLR